MDLDEKFHELRSKYRIINRTSGQNPYGRWYWDGTQMPYRKPTSGQVKLIEAELETKGVRLGINAPDTRV